MSTSQLSKLLPLPEEELKQVLDYASTLSKSEAASHFGDLLGASPAAVDFIATFNSRRQDPAPVSVAPVRPSPGVEAAPKHVKAPKKKKAALHTPAPRQIADFGLAPGTTYNKKSAESDYISSSSAGPSGHASPRNPSPRKTATPPPRKAPPSAAGHLISDLPKPKSKSTPGSRSSTPAPKAKVSIAGGTVMHGASTALSDLDDAIRTLELTTNPTQSADAASRRCNCVATRHPLLTAAPNCLNCGKVICVKEGLGPCTWCGAPLLSADEVQSMIKELRATRGQEKMAADRESHRRAEVSKAPAPFSRPKESGQATSEAEARALEHRDRLLGFQAQNARRTTVKDEAADFDVSSAVSGRGSLWATPEERAQELRRQQKVLRELEWNARPDYEKRRQVISIDLVGGKVVRKMAAVERPESPEPEDQRSSPDASSDPADRGSREASGGTFSKNPLLGTLIRPVFDSKGKDAALEGRKSRSTQWRRVQDDMDNEAVILDGGAYGSKAETTVGP
ncbi:putative zinc finger motif, C2HC5-type-domain-containing protein [Xylariaceae sp. FL0804]|nr:putative zinc finger motif, C2HC5-type-domain-containing protein [Xylariaceae sp. FL0804]